MFRAVSSIAKGIGRNAPKIFKGASPLIGKVFKGIKSGAGRAFKGASRLADKAVKGVKAGITRLRNFIGGRRPPAPAPAPAPTVIRPPKAPLTKGAYDSTIPIFTKRGTNIPINPQFSPETGLMGYPKSRINPFLKSRTGFGAKTMTKAERLAQAKTNLKIKAQTKR